MFVNICAIRSKNSTLSLFVELDSSILLGKNPGRAAPNTKNARSIKARQKMQENIKLFKTDLLTYQQAIGGSVIQNIGGVMSNED